MNWLKGIYYQKICFVLFCILAFQQSNVLQRLCYSSAQILSTDYPESPQIWIWQILCAKQVGASITMVTAKTNRGLLKKICTVIKILSWLFSAQSKRIKIQIPLLNAPKLSVIFRNEVPSYWKDLDMARPWR